MDFYLNGKIDETVYNKRHESNIKEIAAVLAEQLGVNEDEILNVIKDPEFIIPYELKIGIIFLIKVVFPAPRKPE